MTDANVMINSTDPSGLLSGSIRQIEVLIDDVSEYWQQWQVSIASDSVTTPFGICHLVCVTLPILFSGGWRPFWQD